MRNSQRAIGIIIVIIIAALLWTTRDTLAARLGRGSVDARLRLRLSQSGVTQLDFGPTPDPALVKLGEALFYDKLLSGNRDIACATCHHPALATADSLPLSSGVGGHGLGTARVADPARELVPRNATDLFNRGSPEWTTMFWDGRVNLSAVNGLTSPAGDALPPLLQTALQTQAMFPVTSRAEMRGDLGDYGSNGQLNEIAVVIDSNPGLIWARLMQRLRAVPGYVELFRAAYPDTPVEQLGFEHAAGALAAYEVAAFTFRDSPWDRYLAGDRAALSDTAKRGALLFYSDAGCAQCHSGNLLTDQQFHNIAVPQLGPGKLSAERLDLGRYLETQLDADRFAFRTPPLRNVTLTAPYMHNGAYADLRAAVRHHLNPAGSLTIYDATTLPTSYQTTVSAEPAVVADILKTLDARLAAPPVLTDAQLADLMAFLAALTSPSAADLSGLVPESVPSGLPVQD
jgi:cytochrome c peroxidase